MPVIKPVVPPLPKLISMDDVEEKDVRWLWYPYIPFGKATIMYGRGGIGKSHIAMDIAARVSTGDPWPGDDMKREPSNVLILNAEDDYEDTLKPRLRRAGANMSRVFVPQSEFFVLDSIGIRQLEEWMRTMAATIVFIDPVAFYIGAKRDMNKMNEVREFTGHLSKIARNSGTAMVLIHHVKKATDDDYNMASGSADFMNAMRSGLFVTKTNDGTRVMRQPKNNNAPEGHTLAFKFNDSKFEWVGEYDDSAVMQPIAAKNAAEVFIRNVLKDGPIPQRELMRLALEAGYKERTLERAKRGVAESYAKREAGSHAWYWRLIGDTRQPYVTATDIGEINGTPTDIPSVEERRGADLHSGEPAGPIGGALDPGADGPTPGARDVDVRGRLEKLKLSSTDTLSPEVRAILKRRGKLND